MSRLPLRKAALIAWPIALIVGGVFGAISGSKLEPMTGLAIGGGTALLIGVGGTLCAWLGIRP